MERAFNKPKNCDNDHDSLVLRTDVNLAVGHRSELNYVGFVGAKMVRTGKIETTHYLK